MKCEGLPRPSGANEVVTGAHASWLTGQQILQEADDARQRDRLLERGGHGAGLVEPIRVGTRDHDDRDVRDQRIGSLARTKRPAVHDGHPEVEDDAHYDEAQWDATVTSIQVARATYRFRGAMKSGPAVGAVTLNQNWRLRSAPLGGETSFRTFSVGVTGGYDVHIGSHFYLYPTAAFTHNGV